MSKRRKVVVEHKETTVSRPRWGRRMQERTMPELPLGVWDNIEAWLGLMSQCDDLTQQGSTCRPPFRYTYPLPRSLGPQPVARDCSDYCIRATCIESLLRRLPRHVSYKTASMTEPVSLDLALDHVIVQADDEGNVFALRCGGRVVQLETISFDHEVFVDPVDAPRTEEPWYTSIWIDRTAQGIVDLAPRSQEDMEHVACWYLRHGLQLYLLFSIQTDVQVPVRNEPLEWKLDAEASFQLGQSTHRGIAISAEVHPPSHPSGGGQLGVWLRPNIPLISPVPCDPEGVGEEFVSELFEQEP